MLLRTAWLVVVLLGPTLHVAAGTVAVPADVATIQAAIDGAHEGDTIVVAPGEGIAKLSRTRSRCRHSRSLAWYSGDSKCGVAMM